MKKATCKELGGVCDVEVTGETAEEMAENGKAHVMHKLFFGDAEHAAFAQEMMAMSEDEQKKFYEEFESTFEQLADV